MLNSTLIICMLVTQASQEPPKYSATLDFHAVHQFDSPIDGGGKVGVTRGGLELRINYDITQYDDLQLRFQYQQDDWDFTGAGLGTTKPWGTVTTIDVALQWMHDFGPSTQLFVGGLIRSSYEDSFSNGIVAGGSIGVIHSFKPNLTLGIGAGVIEQEKDDTYFFPIFVLEWELSDTVRLTTDISTRFGSRSGVELEWTPDDTWSLGLGISYEYSRFRLDGKGIAPDGAGEVTSYPLTLRATFHASDTFDLTIYGGIIFGGELEVTNSASVVLLSSGFDPAGSFGILGRIRF